MTAPDVSRSDAEQLGAALSETKRQFYRHAWSLVPIGVVWFLASLPVVTVGPATVGAYAAVGSVLRTHEVDYGHVADVLRRQSAAALVLSLLPVTAAVAAGLYALEFLRTQSPLAAGLALVSVYAVLFFVLVLVPTFVALSEGDWIGTAVRKGYLWTVQHPTLSLTTAFVTLVVFVVTAALTLGFVLLFAAVAFTFHHVLLADQL